MLARSQNERPHYPWRRLPGQLGGPSGTVGPSDKVALVTDAGESSYSELLEGSAALARGLLAGGEDLNEARVCMLVPPGPDYVTLLWGIWRAGGIAIPLALGHPPAEWIKVVEDVEPEVLVAHPDLASRCSSLERVPLRTTEQVEGAGKASSGTLPNVGEARRAMILHTSGTTARSKGVVSTHRNIEAWVESMILAWGWTPSDRVLNTLPLHHVHGIVNALLTPLACGASCRLHGGFDPQEVWDAFTAGDLTIFMGVPSMYQRLISAWEAAPPDTQWRWSEGARTLRLMVSGSAALPVRVLERWEELTGHRLLERYGMTEVGMALTHPLDGERRPGSVGTPFPGVQVRIVGEDGEPVPAGTSGELEIRGDGVFREYWGRSEETSAAFHGGWFRTGDQVVQEGGAYRILGRRSVDIIKTGGYKVSALEIEDELRHHPEIADCAVVGVPDPHWGERVCVAVALGPGPLGEEGPKEGSGIGEPTLDLDAMRSWAKERLAPYKVPRSLAFVQELPRNAMGKVQKPDVQKLFEEEEPRQERSDEVESSSEGAGTT